LNFLGEVWARRACAVSNQQELTICAKKKGQEEEFFFAKGEFRVASQQPTVARRPRPCQTAAYLIFQILFSFFGKFGEWTWPFRRIGVQHPHFLKLAPTLGSVKSSISHGSWRFLFFSNFLC
jgi:hypothetical protein